MLRIEDGFTYVPNNECPQRRIEVARETEQIGGHAPVILHDAGFAWGRPEYANILRQIDGSGARSWNDANNPGTKVTGGVRGIKHEEWISIRGNQYKNTEMIGTMRAKLTYTIGGIVHRDFVVSAAPNLLFKKGTTDYKDHTAKATKNDGGQIHCEMILAA